MGYDIEDARREEAENRMNEHLEELERQAKEQAEFKQYQTYLAQRRRMRLLMIAASAAISVLAATGSFLVLQKNEIATQSTGGLVTLLSVIFVIAFAGAALIYLRPSSDRQSAPSTEELRGYIDFRLDELLDSNRRRSRDSEKRDKQAAIELLRKQLEADAVKGFVDQIRREAEQAARREGLEAKLQATTQRLSREVQDLARRGNLNLVLGILTTLTGLLTLAYAVTTSPTSTSLPDILGHFLPRLSLAFLIELFAYFFLKLYKQSLGEIKYFQNELTNVESKIAAVMFALEAGNTILLEKVATSLSKTERNFVLQKHQTTVELERERIASRESQKAFQTLSDAIQSLVKAK